MALSSMMRASGRTGAARMPEPQFSKQAAKALSRMAAPTKQRIRKGISDIPDGDIKSLQGYSDGRKRLRIGQYRIIFKDIVDNDAPALYIMDIGSRGDIYK